MSRRLIPLIACAGLAALLCRCDRSVPPAAPTPATAAPPAPSSAPPERPPAPSPSSTTDALAPEAVLALPAPELLHEALERIWEAAKAGAALPGEAQVLSAAADAAVLVEPPDLRRVHTFLNQPEERIEKTRRALATIGDAASAKAVQSLMDVKGKTLEERRAARSSRLDALPAAGQQRVREQVSGARLEARLVAWARAHPKAVLRPSKDPGFSSARDWKKAVDSHESDLWFADRERERARISALPLPAVLGERDTETVYFAIFDRVHAHAYEVEPEELTPLERAIDETMAMRGQVGNGGVEQYFYNLTGDAWPECLAGLKLLHADRTTALFEKALAVFPDGKPDRHALRRRDQLETIERRAPNALAIAGSDLHETSQEIVAKVVEAVRAHPEQITFDRPAKARAPEPSDEARDDDAADDEDGR